jgi:hypothetical protein
MSDPRSPRVHRYADGEFMLCFGPCDGPQLLVLQPLFEEMNRCRATLAGICRLLGQHGIGCWMPDLPGTGESLRDLATTGWEDWRTAVRAAAQHVRADSGFDPATMAWRGGALLDEVGGPSWRFAPTGGRSLLSDLRRSALASGGNPAHPAGYTLSPALSDALSSAEPSAHGAVRTLRLVSDDRPADLRIEGTPVWRRPEPARDRELEQRVADDIRAWIET